MNPIWKTANADWIAETRIGWVMLQAPMGDVALSRSGKLQDALANLLMRNCTIFRNECF